MQQPLLPINLFVKLLEVSAFNQKIRMLVKDSQKLKEWENQVIDTKDEMMAFYRENKSRPVDKENEFCKKFDEIINIGKQRFGLSKIQSNDKQKEEFNVEQTNQNEHKLTDSWTKLKTVELERKHSGYNMNKPKIRTNRIGYTELT